MNLRNHFLKDSMRKVKDAYANGRMLEMIKQGQQITPLEIVKVELEARKLVLDADDFKNLINTLATRFLYDEDISAYLSKQISSKYFMTPS